MFFNRCYNLMTLVFSCSSKVIISQSTGDTIHCLLCLCMLLKFTTYFSVLKHVFNTLVVYLDYLLRWGRCHVITVEHVLQHEYITTCSTYTQPTQLTARHTLSDARAPWLHRSAGSRPAILERWLAELLQPPFPRYTDDASTTPLHPQPQQ